MGRNEISELTDDYSLKKSKNQITCSQFSHSQIDILNNIKQTQCTTLLTETEREKSKVMWEIENGIWEIERVDSLVPTAENLRCGLQTNRERTARSVRCWRDRWESRTVVGWQRTDRDFVSEAMGLQAKPIS